MLEYMAIWIQLTVIAIFLGLTVYLGRAWPRRVILAINALAGGVILFLIIKTVSDIVTRISDIFNSELATSLPLSPVIYAVVSLFGLVAIPLILVFSVGERRRSVVLAVAFGLFNLAMALSLGSEVANGLYATGPAAAAALFLLFLLEGTAIGALLMRGRPKLLYVLSLGLTAGLPALAGFNLSVAVNNDLIVPFIQAAAAGFLVFYLPFSLAVGKDQNDVKWQFIGMLTGLILAGLVATALPLLGG
jgi:ZIP family zinc transporter